VVLACSLAITLVTTLACSVAPSIRALRGDLQSRLISANKGSGAEARHGKGRTALVLAEVALLIVLLVGAGLMSRTFLALSHAEMGFNAERIPATQIQPPNADFKNARQGSSSCSRFWAGWGNYPECWLWAKAFQRRLIQPGPQTSPSPAKLIPETGRLHSIWSTMDISAR
jgi:hypothetical protein